MPLADFNEFGDLPPGIHPAHLDEIEERFGKATAQRVDVTRRLRRVLELASTTGALNRAYVFGSYVSDHPWPNDIDLLLVMRDDFELRHCSAEQLAAFDHERATRELGASVFWIRPAMLLGDPVERLLAQWQVKRDATTRGTLEVIL